MWQAILLNPDTEHTMQAFGEAPLSDVLIATLVHFPDAWWRVFAIGRPLKAAEVFR